MIYITLCISTILQKTSQNCPRFLLRCFEFSLKQGEKMEEISGGKLLCNLNQTKLEKEVCLIICKDGPNCSI